MTNEWWSYILTAVGITGFFLAGRKVWWSWYINIFCQVLWFAYALVTTQYGFIAAALLYTVVFGKNAWQWTKEHRGRKKNATKPGIPNLSIFATTNEMRSALGVVDKVQEDREGLIATGKLAYPDYGDVARLPKVEHLRCNDQNPHVSHYWTPGDERTGWCAGVIIEERQCLLAQVPGHKAHTWNVDEWSGLPAQEFTCWGYTGR
jgi:hypothetical protein